MKIKLKIFAFVTLLSVLISSCSKDNEKQKVLRFGMIPFESADKLIEKATPLMDAIGKGIGMEVKLSVAADYTGVIEALRGKKLDAAFLTPASYILAKQEANARVILKSQRNGNPYYYGAIITRSDSGIKTLQDLKGKSFAFGDPISTSGHVFPRKLLLENKINPDRDFSHLIYSGAHDATVLAIMNKKVDAGATYSDDSTGSKGSWTRYLKPEEIKDIRVLAVTDPIPSDNICVSQDMDPKLAEKLAQVIIDFGKTKEGSELMQKIYKFTGYIRATDADYDPVRKSFEIAGIKLKDTLHKK
ncbi:MAG: phosphate/phosphite/phosphonate ABC transporter substrate-binding protein [Candidatus Sericytochromatia bacterium]|nr:phosphate/phosphite/phosphonate ABC transporter substrate-binding protein [Candidatus Sericytochromatia bacterium]